MWLETRTETREVGVGMLVCVRERERDGGGGRISVEALNLMLWRDCSTGFVGLLKIATLNGSGL